MKQPIYVNFVVPTDEAVRLECQNGANRAEKELFIVDEVFYFFYVMNRNAKTQTVSLREISKEEYYARKSEILNQRPPNGEREWQDGDNSYALKIFRSGTWQRNLPEDDCIFLSENPLKDLKDAVVAEVTTQRDAELALQKEAKTEFARQCGSLSRKLGIDFVNVLRIGPDREKLMQFDESYQQAILAVQKMSIHEKREIYDLLRAGRGAKKEALDKLGIKYFDAKVSLMNFDELSNELKEPLDAYTQESVKEAIRNGVEMEYEQRYAIFQKLMNHSRKLKREAMAELGIKVELVEFKRYPVDRIKKELAASLGIDLSA